MSTSPPSQLQPPRLTTPTLSRLVIKGIQLSALTAATFLLPSLMHRIVESVDEAYFVLGRQARSPYKTVSWTSVVVAMGVVVGWHVWLGRLSCVSVSVGEGEGEGEEMGLGMGKSAGSAGGGDVVGEGIRRRRGRRGDGRGRTFWARVLGRIVVPLFLVAFAVQFAVLVLGRYVSPVPLVVGNTVDVADDSDGAGT